jgi:hypothetical protein
MANEVKIKVSADTERAKEQLRGLGDRARATADKLRGMRGPLLGIAAAAIGGLGMAVKLAEEERIGINRLDVALRSVGTSYFEQKKAIEAVVAAQQIKTNFGDEEQRDALTKLILTSGDYADSLAALPVLLDMAAAMGMNLENSSMLLGRGLSGNVEMFKRYGIEIEKGSDATAVITALTEKFGGQAEAAATPITQLKNRLGDVAQAIGVVLVPVVNAVAVALEIVARAMSTMPGPVARVVAVVTALAGGLAVLGLLLPPLISLVLGMKTAFIAMKVAALSTWASILLPALPVIAIIGGIVMAGVLLMKNWDSISGVAKKVFTFVLNAVENLGNGVIGAINTIIGAVNKVLTFLKQDTIQTLDTWEIDAEGIFEKFDSGVKGIIENTEKTIGGILDTVKFVATGVKKEWADMQSHMDADFMQVEASIMQKEALKTIDVFAGLSHEIAGMDGVADESKEAMRGLTNVMHGYEERAASSADATEESLDRQWAAITDFRGKLARPAPGLFEKLTKELEGFGFGKRLAGIGVETKGLSLDQLIPLLSTERMQTMGMSLKQMERVGEIVRRRSQLSQTRARSAFAEGARQRELFGGTLSASTLDILGMNKDFTLPFGTNMTIAGGGGGSAFANSGRTPMNAPMNVTLQVQGDVNGMDDLDAHIKKTVKEAAQEGGFHGVLGLEGA